MCRDGPQAGDENAEGKPVRDRCQRCAWPFSRRCFNGGEWRTGGVLGGFHYPLQCCWSECSWWCSTRSSPESKETVGSFGEMLPSWPELLCYTWNSHPESASCLHRQHVCSFFQCPLKQIRAATRHVGQARLTHGSSDAALKLRMHANFFCDMCTALC